jgi:hypothetical protein
MKQQERSQLPEAAAANSEKDAVLILKDCIQQDHALEHELTAKQVLKKHPVLVWWCFYWSLAAVGW